MSETQQADRQLPITQIDEIWNIAEKRWGSAGRRHPPPDPRFGDLRTHLGKIEALFAKDKMNSSAPTPEGFKRKARKLVSDDVEFDDEIPF